VKARIKGIDGQIEITGYGDTCPYDELATKLKLLVP
jgi:hypothetical protein